MSRRGQITDAELYNDEKELLGIVNEFKIPMLENTTIEQEGLGSVGVLKLPARGLKALDGSIKLFYPDADLVAQMLIPNIAVKLQIHERLDIFGPDGFDADASVTLITIINAMFSKVEGADNKKGEYREVDGEFTATRLVQKYSNRDVPLLEVDLFTKVHNVNGKPVWPH